MMTKLSSWKKRIVESTECNNDKEFVILEGSYELRDKKVFETCNFTFSFWYCEKNTSRKKIKDEENEYGDDSR